MYCAYPHCVYINSVAKLWDFECVKHIAHTVNTVLFHVSIRLFLVWSKVNVSKHFNIAYTHWHNVQHNFNPSRRHTKVTDVKEWKRAGTLQQEVSQQALSFAGKEWTLILLRHTNLLQNKYTNELIYMPLLWVREQCEVYVILAYDAVWPDTGVSKLHRTWCLRQVSMEATASSETSAKLWQTTKGYTRGGSGFP